VTPTARALGDDLDELASRSRERSAPAHAAGAHPASEAHDRARLAHR